MTVAMTQRLSRVICRWEECQLLRCVLATGHPRTSSGSAEHRLPGRPSPPPAQQPLRPEPARSLLFHVGLGGDTPASGHVLAFFHQHLRRSGTSTAFIRATGADISTVLIRQLPQGIRDAVRPRRALKIMRGFLTIPPPAESVGCRGGFVQLRSRLSQFGCAFDHVQGQSVLLAARHMVLCHWLALQPGECQDSSAARAAVRGRTFRARPGAIWLTVHG
jgi:hypothetical protein